MHIDKPEGSFLCSGPPESGKTELIAQTNDGNRVLAYTNVSKLVVNDRFKEHEKKPTYMTASSIFDSKYFKLMGEKLQVDEYSMLPLRYYTTLYLPHEGQDHAVLQGLPAAQGGGVPPPPVHVHGLPVHEGTRGSRLLKLDYSKKNLFTDNMEDVCEKFWEDGIVSDFKKGGSFPGST